MYRNQDYERDLARELDDPVFAQGFLLDLIEGRDGNVGLGLEPALKHTIRRMGVAEYCRKARRSKQVVNNFLKSKRGTKPATLNGLLKPFGLRVRLMAERVGLKKVA